MKIQGDFSRAAFPRFWQIADERDLVLRLEFLSNALAGEVGEFANIVKKIARRELYGGEGKGLGEAREELEEELIDVFIYIMTVAALLGFDLEKAYLAKLEKNKERFLGDRRR